MNNKINKYINRIKFVGASTWDAMSYYLTSPGKVVDDDSQVVVYLGDFLQARIPRLAKAVTKQHEFETILITFRNNNYKQYNTEYFDKQLSYRTYWHLKSILKKIPKNALIHAFGPPNWATKIAIKQGFKTIMDCQDMTVTNYGLNPSMIHLKLDLPNEKFCLENCDGLISQSHEAWNAFREYGIKKRPKALFFPIMCDETQFIEPIENKFTPGDEIHLVYVGGVVEKSKTHSFHQGLQIHWLIETLNEQKIHLHLYPAPSMSQSAIDEYTELSKSISYFSIHECVPQNELSKEITKYHYGILPFFHETGGRNSEKRKYGTSLKLFNYMEAGLPCIISKDLEFQAWIGTRYGGSIKVAYEDAFNLRQTIEEHDYNTSIQNLKVGRVQIGLNHNINKILEFYKEILDS